ncbi:CAS/CSE protein involved in chromosome segregation [Mycobacteroides abscessus subsp. abscessus]|nr:CAS/CSE protein involved in chromosome segregation [Mycobacteroides abscessus subsp. abscessus]
MAGAAAVPDGLIVDEAAGVMYWTNMGLPAGSSATSSLTGIAPFNEVNGSLERARMDGSERAFILPPGSFVTGKQLAADFAHGWLYFADREGMRLFRVGVDGTGPQVLVQNGDYAVASCEHRRECRRTPRNETTSKHSGKDYPSRSTCVSTVIPTRSIGQTEAPNPRATR